MKLVNGKTLGRKTVKVASALMSVALAMTVCAGLVFAASSPARKTSHRRTRTAPASTASSGSSDDAGTLVRNTVQHELKAADEDHTRWRYKLRKTTATGTQTREIVDTDQGGVARTIAINDKPLTPEQRAADDKRLQDFLASPAAQEKKRREARQDEAQVKKMFQSFPDAFIYSYAGPSAQGQQIVNLKFEPNPNYKPTSRETTVFAAMAGNMTIDKQHQRIVKMDAHLMREVKFGYGVLARLEQGGKFSMVKTKVANDYWTLTALKLNFKGKALFFKSLTLDEEQEFSDFHRVSPGISLKQGVEMLSTPASDYPVSKN